MEYNFHNSTSPRSNMVSSATGPEAEGADPGESGWPGAYDPQVPRAGAEATGAEPGPEDAAG